jgi:hypothetical protein
MNEKAIDVGPVKRALLQVPDGPFSANIAREADTPDFIPGISHWSLGCLHRFGSNFSVRLDGIHAA